jgi:dihydrofolate reductase
MERQREVLMGGMVAQMSMSLDGFIADPADGVEHLFDWYENGPVEFVCPDPRWTFHVSEASAGHLREGFGRAGALICGRRLFEHTNAWGGNHPLSVPVFVVTHSVPDGWPQPDKPFTFVTDGVESAVAQAKAVAGDKIVAVASPNIAQQCLDAGLLDGIGVDLVPVLLGDGIRFFDNLRRAPLALEGPQVVEGTGVTHLYYRVKPA